jgi:hypothetical protein
MVAGATVFNITNIPAILKSENTFWASFLVDNNPQDAHT